MIDRQQLEGKWNEVKGRLKEKWGSLTDDELTRAEGSVEQLVGVVQRNTGRAKEEVEQFLHEIIAGAGNAYESVASTAKGYASDAGEALRQGYGQAASTVAAGYRGAETAVRRNPVESIAVAFGAGLISGVVVGLLLKNR
jgi:uncharacterized protein YjbJ (UPF0337 family)